MIKIAPSVLSCDFSRLGAESLAMEQAGADMLHLDVMDGHFVPNITFGAPIVKTLRPVTDLFFDVHLMISEPLRYIDDFAEAGADGITFHVEADSDIGQTIERIRAHGIRPGLVVGPATPIDVVFPYLHLLDMVLVMTVEPGFGGQKFMNDIMPKLVSLREESTRRDLSLAIQVDGGIDAATAPVAVANGADVLVAGSHLFRQSDYGAAVSGLRQAAGGGHQ